MIKTTDVLLCDCTAAEHFDAADRLATAAELTRILADTTEQSVSLTGDEEKAFCRVRSLLRERAQRLRDHAYAQHGEQRMADWRGLEHIFRAIRQVLEVK
jgi:hypothetical protein